MRFFLLAFCILSLNISAEQPVANEQEKIEQFYDSLFEHLENDYLHRSEYDWVQIKQQTLSEVQQAENFEASLQQVGTLFDAIGCNHCQLFAPDNFYRSSLNKQLGQEDFSMQFLLKYQEQPGFSVSVINDDIGYINMPGMLMIDLSLEELSAETQKMYDAIAEIAEQKSIKGWIVDLRFNIGGNAYPMIAALHFLLGDSTAYKTKDAKGAFINHQTLKGGGFFVGDELKTRATPSLTPDQVIPVAVITGKMTASAGENVAVAFINRGNMILIGETTYGFLTGNNLVDLPFDTQLAYTNSFIVDKEGLYREAITPDIPVSKQDNFEDILKDENIVQAIQFISGND